MEKAKINMIIKFLIGNSIFYLFFVFSVSIPFLSPSVSFLRTTPYLAEADHPWDTTGKSINLRNKKNREHIGSSHCPYGDCPEDSRSKLTPKTHTDPSDLCNNCTSSPFSCKTGNYNRTEEDIILYGHINLDLRRTYNSNDNMRSGLFGYGWTFNYGLRLREISGEEEEYVLILMTSGKRFKFMKNPDGTYNSPEGRQETLVKNGDGTYTLRRFYRTGYILDHYFNEDGNLIGSRDLNGNQLTITYQNNCPVKVFNDSGDKLTFTKNDRGFIGQVTDNHNRSIKYEYDEAGDLIKVTDIAGNKTFYQYDDDHNLTSIKDGNGNVLVTVVYDENTKKVTSYSQGGETWSIVYVSDAKEPDAEGPGSYGQTIKKDAEGNKWIYSFDVNGVITEVEDPLEPLGKKAIRVYENDTVKSMTDARGNTWEFTYDEHQNPISKTDPKGYITRYTYDLRFDRLATKTDALGRVTKYEYDNRGNLFRIIRDFGGPLENAILFSYDKRRGNRISKTDPMGYVTIYEYDAEGNLTRVIDAEGNTTTYDYDVYGNMLAETDALDNTTIYSYDPNKNINLASVMNALEHTINFIYDEKDNITSITDEADHTTQYEYDKFSRRIKRTDPRGNITSYKYEDPMGKLSSITDMDNKTTRLNYNSAGLLAEVKDARGNRVIFDYDENYNVKKVTDANGNTTQYEYDEFDRVIKITDSEENSTILKYDRVGRLQSVTDANYHSTVYEYDRLDRLIKTIYTDGTYEEYTYYLNDDLETVTDREGKLTRYLYDKLGRIKEKIFFDTSSVIYSYNARGDLFQVTDSNGTTRYYYDEIGQIRRVTYPGGIKLSYEYDKRGNTKELIYPDGDRYTFVYNEINLIDQIMDDTGQILADYSYDNLWRKTAVDYFNGTKTSYGYDELSRLTSITNQAVLEQNILYQVNYGYDKGINLLYQKNLHENGTGEVYTYDKTYQLINAKYMVNDPVSESNSPGSSSFLSQTTFNYDPMGNRLSKINNETITYSSNDLNQYLTVDGIEFSYDNNGNLINDGMNIYSYDYEDRLVSVDTPSGTVTYRYDYLGRRISKTTSTETINYLYDGFRLIAEMDSSNNILRKYIPDPSGSGYLMMKEGGDLYVYQNNQVDAPVLIVDEDARVIWRAEYDAFGQVVVVDENPDGDLESVVNNIRFPGQYYDEETGLHYNMMRYYDPEIGRYLSPDPIGFAGDLNLYRYVGNNPVRWVDPWGLFEDDGPWARRPDFDNIVVEFVEEKFPTGKTRIREEKIYNQPVAKILAKIFEILLVSKGGPTMTPGTNEYWVIEEEEWATYYTWYEHDKCTLESTITGRRKKAGTEYWVTHRRRKKIVPTEGATPLGHEMPEFSYWEK